jgi:hypothetical protein
VTSLRSARLTMEFRGEGTAGRVGRAGFTGMWAGSLPPRDGGQQLFKHDGRKPCSRERRGDPAHAIAPRSAEVGPLPPAGCDLPLAPDMTPWSVVRAF